MGKRDDRGNDRESEEEGKVDNLSEQVALALCPGGSGCAQSEVRALSETRVYPRWAWLCTEQRAGSE